MALRTPAHTPGSHEAEETLWVGQSRPVPGQWQPLSEVCEQRSFVASAAKATSSLTRLLLGHCPTACMCQRQPQVGSVSMNHSVLGTAWAERVLLPFSKGWCRLWDCYFCKPHTACIVCLFKENLFIGLFFLLELTTLKIHYILQD